MSHTNNIDPSAFFKFSYGLFVLTARDGDKDNGCIINTAQQLTSQPGRITIAVNKQNFTHDMIKKTGAFNVSVLTETVPFEVFKHFGFQSGKNVNKFENPDQTERTSNGICYIGKHTNAVFSASVTDAYDYGTHTLFIGDVTEAQVLSDEASVTYAYYFAHIKPKPQPKKFASGKVFVCKICGYVYDEEKEGVPFDQLPDDWVCPLCKHPKTDFELQ